MSDDESIKVPQWFASPSLQGPIDSPPPSVPVHVEFGARSRRGPLRTFNDDLMQLTHDHTLDREHPRKAVISDVSTSTRDQQHIVTETLGGSGSGTPRIDVERCDLLNGDVILVSTNGLTDVADDAQIAATLRLHSTPDDQCRALVELAINLGGKDDVTALVAHYRIPA